MSDKHDWKFKGRGSQTFLPSRFDVSTAQPEHDGWQLAEDSEEAESKPQTVVVEERARSIISRNKSPDVGFEASINPYRGCEHGCFYCFARPSHSYLDLSPGLDFETKLFAKTNAPELVRAELMAPKYSPVPIALGINTDAYQPIERKNQITRKVLEVLVDFRHPVSFVTKSALILRDLDLLENLASDDLVHVAVSVTTLDNRLSAKMEPRAAAPHRRLEVIRRLSERGIPVGVMVAPVVPMLTDSHLEQILEQAAENGARSAGYVLLRLPHELKELSREWLTAHYPDRANHIVSLIQQMHAGKDYRSEFGTRMRGTGPFAQLIEQRFKKAKARYGYSSFPKLNTRAFKRPPAGGDQPGLF